MGHQRVGVLPATMRWGEVVDLISGGADVRSIAAAASGAAEDSMIDAANDPSFQSSLWLLTQIPLAARSDYFAGALRRLGLPVPEEPTLVQICTAMMAMLDDEVQRRGTRTDAGEIAQLAAVESLTAVAGRQIADLYKSGAENARTALAGLATVTQFSVLAQDFFARLTRRYLDYYLSREIAQHVGVQKRFQTVTEHREFEIALERHCREAAVILHDYAGEWFSKATYQTGIDRFGAGNFADYAFEKMRTELAVRRDELA
jgi:hypothetical protein